jgi:hypothetical protein
MWQFDRIFQLTEEICLPRCTLRRERIVSLLCVRREHWELSNEGGWGRSTPLPQVARAATDGSNVVSRTKRRVTGREHGRMAQDSGWEKLERIVAAVSSMCNRRRLHSLSQGDSDGSGGAPRDARDAPASMFPLLSVSPFWLFRR